ncbi:MAG: TetR/AcrR family transcriptional regulator, partial [Candidatus Dadabacteria bacterium]
MVPNADRREPVLSCQPRKRGRPRGSQARQRILQHAEQAFATRGYHGCTVEDILSASGVSRRTFYRHFANRDEVFRGLFVEKTDALATMVERFRQAPTSAQDAYLRLGALFEHYLDAMFAVGDLLPVLVREAMSEPEYATIRERMLAQFRETIRTIL